MNGALSGERVADARLWMHEFLSDTSEHATVRLALCERGEWSELQPFRADRYPFASLVGGDHAGMLDVLGASAVAAADRGADVFACPYLHNGRRRGNGGALARRHVHADIDGPLDLVRAQFVGAMALASGSLAAGGEPRGHVYVRLTQDVPAHAHAALCRALGQLVGGADHDTSKVGDGDVLRPAGTLNHKRRGAPAAVRWLIRPDDERRVKTWEPALLARLLHVPWPVPEPVAGPSEQAATGTGRARNGGADPRGSGGGVMRRLAGLISAVTAAPEGNGNATLNWSAGKAAAVLATQGDGQDDNVPAPGLVRDALVAAFLARPIPRGETPHSREREARATVESGWKYGTTCPDKALESNTQVTPNPAVRQADS